MQELVLATREGLAELADPDKAAQMQHYLKSAMPFRGVLSPARKNLTRRLFREHPLPDGLRWEEAVRELWFGARYREERYAALDLMAYRPYARLQSSRHLGLYAELIISGAWWDYVDDTAIHRIGPVLRTEHDAVAPELRGWAIDENRWKRRAAVICQVLARERTDVELLGYCVEVNADDADFFLRKGIGWALRDYAKTDPGWVAGFVAAHPNLSPLSRREALKHAATS